MVDYYKILRLDYNASLDDVKKAYRQLAREYHPDINHSPDAQELFISITEAYEYLTKKLTIKNDPNYYHWNANNNAAQSIIDEWLAAERERIRTKAKMHARMRYEQFKKSSYYKSTEQNQIKTIALLALIVGVFVMIGSVFGTIHVISKNDKFENINYIGSSVIIFIVGVVLTSVSISKLYNIYKK